MSFLDGVNQQADDRYDPGPCIHRLDDGDCYKCLNTEKSGTKWADKYCYCDGYEPFWKDEVRK